MIRPIATADVPGLKLLIDATGLFPSSMLDGMIAGYLSGDVAGDIWLTLDDGDTQAIAYCAPERMTEGTWNLYLIAVHPGKQSKGIGATLLRHLEVLLQAKCERILLVETSGLPDYARTRAFYLKCGYHQEARIRDFYQAGEDKIVFRKVLTAL